MAGFKNNFEPGLRFNRTNRVTADEQDDYYIYTIGNPGTSNIWFGTAPIAGTSATGTLVITNRYPDYPRNINYVLVGTGAGMAGTFITSGLDQFGSPVSETVATGTANNGGTVVGTQIFGRIDGGTIQFGTAVGNGTTKWGFVPGTGCLFGLPVKIAGTQDVVLLSHAAGTGIVSYNGGTVSTFINTTQMAVRPAAAVTGSETINAWIVSSYVPDNVPQVANLKSIG